MSLAMAIKCRLGGEDLVAVSTLIVTEHRAVLAFVDGKHPCITK